MSENQAADGQQHHQVTLSTRLEEQDRYLMHDLRGIRRMLQALIEKRSLVTVHLAPRNRMLPSALVALSEDEQSVFIDGSRDAGINQAIAQANHVTCVSMLNRVPVQFRLAALERFDLDGMVTFRAALPDSVLYLQRRQFHRVHVPVAEPAWCEVSMPAPAPPEDVAINELRILDISIGGCLVSLPPDCRDFGVASGFDGTLHLPGTPLIPLRLLVRNRFDPPPQHPTQAARAGCEFQNLPGDAENLIQRYIFKIDRRRKARERGEA
jgi:c-di-GMP-binding flagellar brake protein YcgR